MVPKEGEMQRFQGKVAIVTGAGSGTGANVAVDGGVSASNGQPAQA